MAIVRALQPFTAVSLRRVVFLASFWLLGATGSGPRGRRGYLVPEALSGWRFEEIVAALVVCCGSALKDNSSAGGYFTSSVKSFPA